VSGKKGRAPPLVLLSRGIENPKPPAPLGARLGHREPPLDRSTVARSPYGERALRRGDRRRRRPIILLRAHPAVHGQPPLGTEREKGERKRKKRERQLGDAGHGSATGPSGAPASAIGGGATAAGSDRERRKDELGFEDPELAALLPRRSVRSAVGSA